MIVGLGVLEPAWLKSEMDRRSNGVNSKNLRPENVANFSDKQRPLPISRNYNKNILKGNLSAPG